ncbi:MAG: carbohydrate ABC transporter permease [Chloroflexi bacterium]|jgi:glucose/mannose transport system permease protein|nr:carbohydrate ABC transporter permease [Anaerolineaceae bacterium]NMB88656.1 carbohydrate ABC transporter permease [Chloroflexota bacterium]
MKSKSPSIRLLVILVLVVLSIAYLLPIYVMIVTSLKSIEEINQGSYLVPTTNPQWNNYLEVLFGSQRFRSEMFPRMVNSVIISFSVTALAAFIGGLGGYYLSRSRSRFARVLFILVGIGLYLPYQVVIIPLSILMARTGLSQSYGGLIFSYLILNVPLASVLMGTFFLSIPRELEEAAEVDGASRVQTFFNIVVPISLPAYTSVAIIVFTQVWNEFFLALTLSSRTTQTIQVVMAEAKGTTLVLYNLQMAAALIAVAIPMLFFLLLGRYFIRGILAGALKG